MPTMRKAAAAALEKILQIGKRSNAATQKDDKSNKGGKKCASRESEVAPLPVARAPRARRLTMKHFRESADQLMKLRHSSSSALDDYFADRSIPDLGLEGSWSKDMDMMGSSSPGRKSIEKVESWISSLTPPPFLPRWASEASLSEAIEEPITPLTPRSRHFKRRYISQVEYDAYLEKRKLRRQSDPSSIDHNGNIFSATQQNTDLLCQLLLEQDELVKQKSLQDDDYDESTVDFYFDDDWLQQPDAS